MNAYAETQAVIVEQIQAERREAADAARTVAAQPTQETARERAEQRAAWVHRLATPMKNREPAAGGR